MRFIADPTKTRAVRRTGHDGAYLLVHARNGKPVEINEKVHNVDGEGARIAGGAAPHKPTSTGRVWVDIHESLREFFPSVYGLRWARISEH